METVGVGDTDCVALVETVGDSDDRVLTDATLDTVVFGLVVADAVVDTMGVTEAVALADSDGGLGLAVGVEPAVTEATPLTD